MKSSVRRKVRVAYIHSQPCKKRKDPANFVVHRNLFPRYYTSTITAGQAPF